MKRIVTLTLLLVASLSLLSNPIDEATAKQLAENFWKENHIMGVRNGIVFMDKTSEAQFVNVAPQHGYSDFFIFNNTSGPGYVIIAADDCVVPILGYSYVNNFDTETLPPNLKEWLNDYAEQIETAVTMRASATAEIRAEWDCLRQGKPLPIKSEKAVTPLISTTWDQSPYYNALCPYDNSAHERTLTGCVATALGQVLKYWSYPEHGYGSHSYVPNSHPEYGSLYVDFSSVNYQWSSMPNNVTSSNNAVATLLYHCGVSVNMDYGISGSPDYGSSAYTADNGTNRPSAETALKTYFNYKSTLHSVSKSDYSDSQWINLLKNELDHSRPMLYRGSGNQGGHSFICDGYNNNDYFHFNWGWSGHYNDYFYINNLNPTSFNFSSGQQAVIGIEPNGSGGGGGGGGGGSSEDFDLVYHNNLSMDNTEYWFYDPFSVYAEVLNSGSGNFSGYIGAGVFRKNENGEYRFLDVMSYWDKTSNPLQPNYYVYGNLECEAGPPYIPGSYGIAMVYSMDGDLWNFIDDGNYNDVFFDIVYATDIETFSNFTITTGDYLYYSETATVNVDIWNSGNSTFYGKFRVNLSNADGSWAQNIQVLNCSNGLQANYHYTNGVDFTGEITVEPGTYYLELAYQESGSSNWYYAGASEYQNPVVVEVVAPTVTPDSYEANNTVSTAYRIPFNLPGTSTLANTAGSNLHNSTDVDYYKLEFNPGMNYIVTARLYDSYNNGGSGTYYTVDAKFAYSTDGTNWSEFYDDEMPSSITVSGGSTLYFQVLPYFEGKTGTYLLSFNIASGTGLDEDDEACFSIYPNPVKDMVNVNCKGMEEIRLFNAIGQMTRSVSTNGTDLLQINMAGLPCGVYLLQAVSQDGILTKRIVKAE